MVPGGGGAGDAGAGAGGGGATGRAVAVARTCVLVTAAWFMATARVLTAHCASGGGAVAVPAPSCVLLLPAYLAAYTMALSCAAFAVFRDANFEAPLDGEEAVLFSHVCAGCRFSGFARAGLAATAVNMAVGVAVAWRSRGKPLAELKATVTMYSFFVLVWTLACVVAAL